MIQLLYCCVFFSCIVPTVQNGLPHHFVSFNATVHAAVSAKLYGKICA